MLVLDQFLAYRINRLAAQISRLLHQIYGEKFGIDIPEWRVLATLGAREPVTAGEIVRDTATHKSTISRAVARLESRGWIARIASSSDRRAQEMRLTADGRAAYEAIVPMVLAVESDILERLGPAKQDVLDALARLESAVPAEGAEDGA